MKTEFPYLNRFFQRGKWYCYYRRAGHKKILIDEEFNTFAFRDCYNEIEQQFELPGNISTPGTFKNVAEKFLKCARFKKLSLRTQKEYSKVYKLMYPEFGEKRIKGMTTRFFTVYHERLADTPGMANNMLKANSKLFKWTTSYGFTTSNPITTDIERFQLGEWVPWEPDQMETFEEKAKGSSLTAYMLALYTGQREADVLRMRRDAVDEGIISVVQDKGGAKLWIPIHPILQVYLDALETENNEIEGLTIVRAIRTGSPLTLDGFRTNFRKELDKVGLLGLKPPLTFHGLRKNATGALFEAGCTPEEVKSITPATGQPR